MVDLLKKSVYAAIGFAVVSRERVEELARKIAKEASMTEKEGRKFVEEMLKKSDETRATIEKMVREKIDEGLKKMDVPSRRELTKLEERVRKLEEANGIAAQG